MARLDIRTTAALLTALLMTVTALGQSPEIDAEAMDAFKKLVGEYRARPALSVSTTIGVDLKQGEAVSRGEDVAAELTWIVDAGCLFKLRGYECHVADGKLQIVHEKTEDKYFSMPDDGSPYYLLMNLFVDIPFPHLAMALGEEEVDEFFCMQFHPKAPWARPTGVTTRDADDGRALQVITLTSDYAAMEVAVDPETSLIDAIDLTLTGGPFVQEGTEMIYRHRFVYDLAGADRDVLAFDAGERVRVDLLAELSPPARAGGGPLVGNPAPPFLLATADGGAIDIEELRGQVVVLDFWATWCGPCRRALPLLHEVAEWAAEEELPVKVVTVNVFEKGQGGDTSPDARLAKVREYWKSQKFTLPVAMDFTDETAAAYGVQGIPATFVVRSDGTVHAQHTGAGEGYVATLKEEIRSALAALEAD